VNLVLPLIGMFIIWSRPVGTMSHSTGSAVNQYSRAGPFTVKAASSVVPATLAVAAPASGPASAAFTFGGTLDALRQPIDVDLPFVAADLVPGERAEERAAAQRQEPAPVHAVEVHRAYSRTVVVIS